MVDRRRVNRAISAIAGSITITWAAASAAEFMIVMATERLTGRNLHVATIFVAALLAAKRAGLSMSNAAWTK